MSSKAMDAARRPAAKRDTRSGGRRSATALATDERGFGKQILPKHISGVVRCRTAGFQRLGPNAGGGGAERGTGGRWSRDVVVVHLVLGTALGVVGSRFGVCGSWSRMRHQRAAAG